ncbi:hypothetical protein BH18ACT6_BH18ACT6_24840 [soil metagenome]
MTVLATGGALLFSKADQAERIAADARTLGELQAASAETATFRAALVIAFASTGDVVPAVALEAVDEAVDAARRAEDRFDAYPVLRSNASLLVDTTEEVRRVFSEGDTAAARELVETEVLPTVSQLATDLSQTSATVAGRIQAEQAQAGRLARAASFVVALIVPVLAVVIVRRNTRRRLERERLESEMLRQRELAEARDRLIAGLSHQLRTPITGIYGWSDLLGQNPEIVAEGSLAILGQAGDLRRMVDDILVAARLDTSALVYLPTSRDVGKVVAQAVSHFERIGHEVRIECAAAEVFVDGPRLEKVVHNLVSNALRHGQPPVEVVGRVAGPVYRLAVIDRGGGLKLDRMENPFAPFAHAPEAITTANSLGLGLAVADSLARLVGGGIEYLRRDGCTVFALTIPLEPARITRSLPERNARLRIHRQAPQRWGEVPPP